MKPKPLTVPVSLNSFSTAAKVDIDPALVNDIVEQSRQAHADAKAAAMKAEELGQKACQAQARIHAHNAECAAKWSWSRPAGWTTQGDGRNQYLGYSARDGDGMLVPHGEGESQHPSGLYRCAQFDKGLVAGLFTEQYPDGTVKAGVLYHATWTGDFTSQDSEIQAVMLGHWASNSEYMFLKLGAILYNDGSAYHGHCQHNKSTDQVGPSGFGVWQNDSTTVVVHGYFEGGFAEGYGLIHNPNAPDGDYAAYFSRGQMVKRSKG